MHSVPQREQVLVAVSRSDLRGLRGQTHRRAEIALTALQQRHRQLEPAVLGTLGLALQHPGRLLDPGRGVGDLTEVTVVDGELDGDAGGSSYVAGLQVLSVGALPQRDAVPHLADPPGTLGHPVEVVGAQRLVGVGGREQVERLAPRVARDLFTCALRAHGDGGHRCHCGTDSGSRGLRIWNVTMGRDLVGQQLRPPSRDPRRRRRPRRRRSDRCGARGPLRAGVPDPDRTSRVHGREAPRSSCTSRANGSPWCSPTSGCPTAPGASCSGGSPSSSRTPDGCCSISWGEWAVDATAQPLRRGIGLGQIDYYVLKPWRTADELFHRTVTEFLHEWVGSDASLSRELTVVADAGNARASELRSLLTRNRVPFVFHTTTSTEGRKILTEVQATRGGRPDRPATQRPLARRPVQHRHRQRLRRAHHASRRRASSTSPSSEPARPVSPPPCTQPPRACAPWSSSARRSAARPARAPASATTSGSSEASPAPTSPNAPTNRPGCSVRPSSRCARHSHSAPTATGSTSRPPTARRSPPASSFSRWASATGAWASQPWTSSSAGASSTAPPPPRRSASPAVRSFVVGGGNSAGQAAVHLARYARRVTILVRRATLAETMSRYLIDEIEGQLNIDVRYETEIVDGSGDDALETLTLQHCATSSKEVVPADAVFILIGAQPHTAWLPAEIARDRYGFVVTGPENVAVALGTATFHVRVVRCPVSSRSVTSARDRSSGSPPPPERARSRSNRSTSTSSSSTPSDRRGRCLCARLTRQVQPTDAHVGAFRAEWSAWPWPSGGSLAGSRRRPRAVMLSAPRAGASRNASSLAPIVGGACLPMSG